MDGDSSDSADLASSLCLHRAPSRRLPSRVVRHGPGRRRSGRFVQFRKEPRDMKRRNWSRRRPSRPEKTKWAWQLTTPQFKTRIWIESQVSNVLSGVERTGPPGGGPARVARRERAGGGRERGADRATRTRSAETGDSRSMIGPAGG